MAVCRGHEKQCFFSGFAQFVHRCPCCDRHRDRRSSGSLARSDNGSSLHFRLRCCHGFDSTAGTPILAAQVCWCD